MVWEKLNDDQSLLNVLIMSYMMDLKNAFLKLIMVGGGGCVEKSNFCRDYKILQKRMHVDC